MFQNKVYRIKEILITEGDPLVIYKTLLDVAFVLLWFLQIKAMRLAFFPLPL